MSEFETYLQQWFTPEFARRVITDLNLTCKNDILKIEGSQIDTLNWLDGQKRIFKRIRETLTQEFNGSKNWAKTIAGKDKGSRVGDVSVLLRRMQELN